MNKKNLLAITGALSLFLCVSITGKAIASVHTSSDYTAYVQKQQPTITKQKIKINLPSQLKVWQIYGLNKMKFEPSQKFNKDFVRHEKRTEKSFSSFKGFKGIYATDTIEGNNIPILNDSLNISSTGNWQALGLIRNETNNAVGSAIVEADLYSSDNTLLSNVKEKVMIENIRPGEPAPFKLSSNVSVKDVSRVEWKVLAKDSNQNTNRDIHIEDHYQLAYGQTKIKNYDRISDNGTFPYVLSTGLVNLSSQEIKHVTLVVAWITPDGKVYFTDQTHLYGVNKVNAGEMANFKEISINNSSIAPNLTKYQHILWAVIK